MHCKTCNYPLWQLAVRQCPECGSAFKPSDFEFTLNAVRFCCPHCEQAYYGTGPNGHLVPRAFNCVSCGKPVDMDEMVLQPTEGVKEHQTTATAISWANRREKGWFKAFFITMGNGMGNPNRAIDAVPEGSPTGLAIVYMAIHVIAQMVCSLAVLLVFAIGIGTMARGGPSLGLIGAAIGTLVGVPLLVLAWASLIHVLLVMTGPTRGLGRTIHAVCYSAGNNFIMMVPCLGAYFLWIPGGLWWSISGAFMLARAHGVRGWRAAVAVAVPAVLVIVLIVGGFVAMMYAGQRSMGMMAATMPAMGSTHGTLAAAGQRVSSVMAMPGQTRPGHPADLLFNHLLQPQEVLLPGSASDTVSCSVQNLSLNEIGYNYTKSVENQQIVMGDPALSGPACRVGDFVFTYAGMADPVPNANLWLAVGWPDPTLNPKDPSQVVVIKPDGVSTVMTVGEFAGALDEQNELRKKYGLAALPHPRTVVATSKKVASPYGTVRSKVKVNGVGVGPGGTGGTGGTGEQFGGAGDQARVNSLSGALRGVGKPTEHIAQLMGSGGFSAFEFMDASEFSDGGQIRRMTRITFGATNLRSYSKMTPDEKRAQEKIESDEVDAKTIAYRIGDTVFTHRGIDPALVPYGSKQHGLWTVIAWPEAMKADAADPYRMVYVGLADGSTQSFRIETMDEKLDEQNALRAEFGLEALPDPEGVKEGSPALGTAAQKMKVPGP